MPFDISSCRVTAAEVWSILDSPSATTDLTPHILTANTVVNDLLTGKGLSDTTLKLIELWLSAHFVACSIRRDVASEGTGPANASYVNTVSGNSFLSTRYGQQACSLDSTRTLAHHAKSLDAGRIRNIVGIQHIGGGETAYNGDFNLPGVYPG